MSEGSSVIGVRVKTLRIQRKLTQEKLAELADLSVDLIKKLETGIRRSCRGDSLERLAAALGVRPADLLTMPAIELSGNTWMREDNDTLAEQLLDNARTVTEANALRLAHLWLIVEPPQVYQLRSGRQIGAGLVEQISDRVSQLRRMDDFVGGGDLAAVVRQELEANLAVLREAAYTEPVGRGLLKVVAELAQLAGWTASDADQHGAAARYYLAGARAAHAAGDAPLAANLLSTLSYQIANIGEPTSAVVLARTAAKGAGMDATHRTRALLWDRVAWAHARARDSDGCRRALDSADDALSSATADDPDPPWTYWVIRDELDVMAGRCYTELAMPLRAEPLLTSVLTGYDAARAREKSLYLTWLADTYVHAREVEQAATVATEALDLAERVNSPRSRDRVRQVGEHLAPYRGAAAVRDFEERLSST